MNKAMDNKAKSWLMCAGLMPLPSAVIKDMENGWIKLHSKERKNKPRCVLTDEQRDSIVKAATPYLKQEIDYSEIYVELCKEGYLEDKSNGYVASYSTVVKIFKYAVRKHKIVKETLFEKVARLRKEGYSDYDLLMMGFKKRYLVKQKLNHSKKEETNEATA